MRINENGCPFSCMNEDTREMAKESFPCRCVDCQWVYAIGQDKVMCNKDMSGENVETLYMDEELEKCPRFTRTVKAAAKEVYDRLSHMGMDGSIPPMVRDAYAMLKKSIELEHDLDRHYFSINSKQ